jgi:CobQ-like glutamine amidotransferase family enzyme
MTSYRVSPGGNPLGQVHRGQGFDTVEYRDGWFRGNLWGGRANVWIYAHYLDSTRP